MNAPCVGLLLAGGRARRMGGGDKSLRVIAGATMLERVAATLSRQCDGLVLSANGDLRRFARFGLPAVADESPDFAGPLAGVLAGLDWIAARRPDVAFAVSAPTDAPFLPQDLATRLFEARRNAGAQLSCARSGGRAHYVAALWPVAMRHALRDAVVGEGVRRLGEFFAGETVACADWGVEPFDPFLNVNAPEDVEDATAIAERFGLTWSGQ